MRRMRAAMPALILAWGLTAAVPSSRADDTTEAERLSASFREAARRVLPAVVTVRSEDAPPPVIDLAPGFGIELPRRPGEPVPPDIAGGSGVIIDGAKGLILTNDHVVADALRLTIVLHDGRERPARRVSRDPKSDLALVAIEPGPEGLPQAEWGDSTSLEIGDWVLAVGQPFGLSGTVTAGIVSGKARGIGMALYEDLVQTDAAINPGNSGGPLVDLEGRVVGINTAIKTRNGGFEGIGFAVPAERARRVAAELAEQGRVRRAYLGVNVAPAPPAVAERLGVGSAVAITAVGPGSPASAAGLRPGDLVRSVDGRPVGSPGAIQSAVEFAPVDRPLVLEIDRDGRSLTVEVVPRLQPDGFGLEEPPAPLPRARPEPEPDRDRLPPDEPPLEIPPVPPGEVAARQPNRFPDLGLRVEEPTPALLRRYNLDPEAQGLVVRGIDPDGPADRAGLELGMMITDVSDRKVTNLAEFRAALGRRARESDLVFRILKGPQSGFRVILRGTAPDAPPDGLGPLADPPAPRS